MKLELILLGLIKKSPKHGYEIKKIIEEEIKPLTNITLTSIYYNLEKLSKRGYLQYDLERSGQRPEKRVYRLTSKGEKRFYKLLIKNFLFLERPFFNLDLILYFLEEIPKKQMQKLISKRISSLESVLNWTEETKEKLISKNAPYHKILIPEHLKRSLEIELSFTKELQKLIK